MKTLFYTFIFSICLSSCSSKTSEYEKTITDYLETKNGVKTDLQIKYSKLDVSDISVADSISILNKKFEAEKNKKIQSIEQTIKHKEKSIAEQKNKLTTAKGGNKIVAQSLIYTWEKELQREKILLDETLKWQPDYINKYTDRNPSDILAKKADITLSFFNPRLQTRQEISMFVILSPDGKECYNDIMKE